MRVYQAPSPTRRPKGSLMRESNRSIKVSIVNHVAIGNDLNDLDELTPVDFR